MILFITNISGFFTKLFPFVAEICKLFKSLRSRVIQRALLFFLLTASSLIAILYYHLHIDAKVQGLVSLGRFKDTIALLRQTESSYFRYNYFLDYEKNASSLDKAYKLFSASKKDIIDSGYSYNNIEKKFRNYQKYMDMLYTLEANEEGPIQKESMQETIKTIGNALEDISQKVFLYKDKSVNNYLFRFRLIMLFIFMAILVPGFFLSFGISKKIVCPLKEIENAVHKIGKGDFSKITISNKSHIEEIQCLLNSINKITGELQHRQEQLIYTKRLSFLGTFIPGIANKLDIPLSNISDHAHCLFENINHNDMIKNMELLRQILTNIDTVQKIVDSMLKFPYTDEYKMKLINLKKFFIEVINSFKKLKNNIPPRIDLIVNIPDGLIIRVDKKSFQQVFINLMFNALQAIPENDNGEVIISARKNREKDCIEIIVKDTGVGIESDKLSHIFEPFFTTKQGYIGLGLYVVNDILKLHNSSIKVISNPGKGTTFIVYVPIGAVSYGV